MPTPDLPARLPLLLEARHSRIAIERPRGNVVVLTIEGQDVGEHGDVPLRALDAQLELGPYTLFIDTRRAQGATLDVSNVWARWLGARRDRLFRIHMLTGSKFVQLTADFVRRWADLGDAMLIYTDGAAFDDALRTATQA